ncbi:MAG: hypothetical protein PHI31_18520 [Desulfuromonadaceae bacterium]|nr:hypothetical protein [Desulfuromonadaceae bacterium]
MSPRCRCRFDQEGDVLMVTEAMKMETNIKAKADGAVSDVKFKEGDKVEKEDLVIVVAE